jgi:N6-adenosine-specific RNA methylase IME4
MGVHEVVFAPVGRHSEKPDEVRRRIERLVQGPYLELFARKPVPGWTTWGNEIAPESAATNPEALASDIKSVIEQLAPAADGSALKTDAA